jgi:signal-transduction protein with cAMP-binding, CBS, and nucleotidyltransferase domain
LQSVIAILKKNLEARNDKDLNQLIPYIKENHFFKQRQINYKHLTEVCSVMKYEYFPKGDFVFTQGDYGDKFYIILNGSVSVLDHSDEYIKHKQEERHKKAMENA